MTSLRARFFTASLNAVRKIAREFGCEIAVELSPHSIETKLELPGKDRRAWDSSLYKNGNVFYSNYANPIKPIVQERQELEEPDEISLEESDAPAGEASELQEQTATDDSPHTTLISSGRYRSYMRQHLISELLTPREQWRLIAYGIIALGLLQLFSLIMVLFTNGTF